jgi:hypothetical protein
MHIPPGTAPYGFEQGQNLGRPYPGPLFSVSERRGGAFTSIIESRHAHLMAQRGRWVASVRRSREGGFGPALPSHARAAPHPYRPVPQLLLDHSTSRHITRYHARLGGLLAPRQSSDRTRSLPTYPTQATPPAGPEACGTSPASCRCVHPVCIPCPPRRSTSSAVGPAPATEGFGCRCTCRTRVTRPGPLASSCWHSLTTPPLMSRGSRLSRPCCPSSPRPPATPAGSTGKAQHNTTAHDTTPPYLPSPRMSKMLQAHSQPSCGLWLT